MAGGDPHPPRPPQEDVEKLPTPSVAPPIAGTTPTHSTFLGKHKIHINSTIFPDHHLSGQLSVVGLKLSDLGKSLNRLQTPSFFQGKPKVTFQKSDKKKLIDGLQHVLIAKCSHGRPKMADFKLFLSNQKLKGKFHVSFFDSKHVFVICDNFEDFAKIWIKQCWNINGFQIRFFKWNENFDPCKESSICPVWIHLPRLPLFLFDEGALTVIANAIGRPLFIDKENISKNKVSYATICVEMNVLSPPEKEIWIHFEDSLCAENARGRYDGFLQEVVYNFIPPYCSACHHLGHMNSLCKRQTLSNVEQQLNTKAEQMVKLVSEECIETSVRILENVDGKEKRHRDDIDKGLQQVQRMLLKKIQSPGQSDLRGRPATVLPSIYHEDSEEEGEFKHSTDRDQCGGLTHDPLDSRSEMDKVEQKSCYDSNSNSDLGHLGLLEINSQGISDGQLVNEGEGEAGMMEDVLKMVDSNPKAAVFFAGIATAVADSSRKSWDADKEYATGSCGSTRESSAASQFAVATAGEQDNHTEAVGGESAVQKSDVLEQENNEPAVPEYANSAEEVSWAVVVAPVTEGFASADGEQATEAKADGGAVAKGAAGAVEEDATGQFMQQLEEVQGCHLSCSSDQPKAVVPQGRTSLDTTDKPAVSGSNEEETVVHIVCAAPAKTVVNAPDFESAGTNNQELVYHFEAKDKGVEPSQFLQDTTDSGGALVKEETKEHITPRKLSSAAAEFTPKWDVLVEELVQRKAKEQAVLVEKQGQEEGAQAVMVDRSHKHKKASAGKIVTDRVQKVIAKAQAVLAEKKAQAQGDHTALNNNAMEQLQERMNRLRGIEVPAAQRLAASTRVPTTLLSDEMKDIICPFKCKSVPNSPPRSKKQSKSLFDSQVYSPATHGFLKRYGSDTSDDTSVDFDCSWQDYDC